MLEAGDGRILMGGLKMDLSKKRIITTSYDPNWYCYKCGCHNIRPALRTRGEAGGSPRQAIAIADQNFLAILPVATHGQCIKIMRIENGSIMALMDSLFDQVGNRVMSACLHTCPTC
jgi:hypothetical protein